LKEFYRPAGCFSRTYGAVLKVLSATELLFYRPSGCFSRTFGAVLKVLSATELLF
jgi:hypothetical protein